MTFLPVDHHRVVGLKGPKYKVGPNCCNPNCRSIAEHAHHMWRRSEIHRKFDWIEVDGWVVAAKVGVCVPCHGYLTENKMSIRLDEPARVFVWCTVTGSKATHDLSHNPVGLIEPQPLTPETLATSPDQGEGSEEGCPFCGQLKRRRSAVGQTGRRRKTWLVKVPEDGEDGAAVLDALVENIAPYVPNANASTVGRYYVLVPALYYAQMNAKNFVETMEGVGG